MSIAATLQRSFRVKKLDPYPRNKPYTPFHRFIQWSMRNIPVARNFAVWGDELFGYNQPNLKNRWWLDLEDVDGELVVPANAGSRGNFKEPKT